MTSDDSTFQKNMRNLMIIGILLIIGGCFSIILGVFLIGYGLFWIGLIILGIGLICFGIYSIINFIEIFKKHLNSKIINK